jgi:hypothetical protein
MKRLVIAECPELETFYRNNIHPSSKRFEYLLVLKKVFLPQDMLAILLKLLPYQNEVSFREYF